MNLLLDPVLLRSFVAVAQTQHFTEAAVRLGLSQSTVSQHIRKLEALVGRRLVLRDTHSVALTTDGDAMVGFARAILETNERAQRHFAGSELRGKVRFATSEDFALTRLSEVLRDFRRDNPQVDLELTIGLSGLLYEKLEAGELDLVLGKRRPGSEHGRLVWRDRLVWIGAAGQRLDPQQPLPLALFPPPSITRAVALETLQRGGRAWRIVCTSGSLSGLWAAAASGLGITPQCQHLLPPGLSALPPQPALPELGEVEFVLVNARGRPQGPVAALADCILDSGNRLQQSIAA